MLKQLKDSRGFTLIELMVVIVILSLLAVLVGPKIIGRSDDAKVADAKVQIRNIETALKLYKLDSGVFPTTEQGLQALVTKPTTGKVPNNYRAEGYLENKNIPKDPWGNDYVYLSPGEHGDYDLSSYGADGARGGEGKNADIESWSMK
ncbi:type II secretion system protein GspG [Geomonas terrae]|uniref:Type II secretion system core protein G n=1 Tax=Geomonas terrae TaxID=2562681 RepID=A0A4S1CK37_9BACT|nr:MULTISPECIES: type II secretion system major pseudopilin GspG [Geomonas]TGU74067.1 type II secretion system protein GspG [Geomonas terrae]TSK06788.1 MAG: type II secretion system protein GspG [Geobacter sp.]